MGMERMGGGERFFASRRTPEFTVETEPQLSRRLRRKNELTSKLYHFASGDTTTSPHPSVSTPQEAMGAYLQLTAGDVTGSGTPTSPPPTDQILSVDPYAEHPFRMTVEDRRAATALAIAIGKREGKTWEFGTVLRRELESFREDFLQLTNVSSFDKRDVAGRLSAPGVRDFRESLTGLVAKYLVLKSKEGEVTTESLRKTLESGLHAYARTFSIDITYYDKVYAWFDSQHQGKRIPQEVYLGRDGMYASLGRRAQSLARERQVDPKERVRARRRKKPIERRPKYLVYPRYYRDRLPEDVKKQYLTSQGISAKTDPIFFDTGYTGTVPEQILNILGVSSKDRDERIKMLSANEEARRIPGIDPAERRTIVRAIEYNMKPEEPSSGIMRDANGKLKHVAQPTTPEEQFIFEMIRMAIVRHYWIDVYAHK